MIDVPFTNGTMQRSGIGISAQRITYDTGNRKTLLLVPSFIAFLYMLSLWIVPFVVLFVFYNLFFSYYHVFLILLLRPSIPILL